jgi:uncharacterized membrane protein YjgN (DUF898 family)
MGKSLHFTFDGGAATYWGTALLALIITVCTLGLAYPWGLCLKQKWIAKHTLIDGRRLRFTAGGTNLIGHWVIWWVLSALTLGIYLIWVNPRVRAWIVEHTDFAA